MPTEESASSSIELYRMIMSNLNRSRGVAAYIAYIPSDIEVNHTHNFTHFISSNNEASHLPNVLAISKKGHKETSR